MPSAFTGTSWGINFARGSRIRTELYFDDGSNPLYLELKQLEMNWNQPLVKSLHGKISQNEKHLGLPCITRD